MRHKLVNLDKYLTDALPTPSLPDEPAEWLALKNRDGECAIIEPNDRPMLLCFTSATWTDAELRDAVDAVQLAGWPSVVGIRGCPRETVAHCRREGVMVLLDAPLRCIMHVQMFCEEDGQQC